MNITTAAYLKNLKKLHRAMLTGVVLISFTAIVIITKGAKLFPDQEKWHNIGQYIAPILMLLGIVLSAILYQKQINAIVQKTDISLAQKLSDYRTASIIRWTCIEGAILVSVVLLFLTGNYYYLIFLFVLLVFFVMYTPSKDQIIAHLRLSSNEQNILNDEYAELA
jgi:divalent metal cation (Fe/Co/Zn/Cd) transporter